MMRVWKMVDIYKSGPTGSAGVMNNGNTGLA